MKRTVTILILIALFLVSLAYSIQNLPIPDLPGGIDDMAEQMQGSSSQQTSGNTTQQGSVNTTQQTSVNSTQQQQQQSVPQIPSSGQSSGQASGQSSGSSGSSQNTGSQAQQGSLSQSTSSQSASSDSTSSQSSSSSQSTQQTTTAQSSAGAASSELDLPPEPSIEQFQAAGKQQQNSESRKSELQTPKSDIVMYVALSAIGLLILAVFVFIIYYMIKSRKQKASAFADQPAQIKTYINPYPGDAFAEYIYSCLNQGFSKDTIYQKFIQEGYQPDQIDYYFEGIE